MVATPQIQPTGLERPTTETPERAGRRTGLKVNADICSEGVSGIVRLIVSDHKPPPSFHKKVFLFIAHSTF
jgi:hypothetical protein